MTRPVVSDTAERLYTALGPLPQGDEAQGWPLLRFCGVVTGPVAEVDGLASDTDTQVGWGPLLDVSLAPTKALPWLGQFVGAVVPEGMPDADARTLIEHAPGLKRGTPAAIVAATRLYLSGSGLVTLTERVGGDAYAVDVAVFGAQVTDLPALTAAVQATLPAGMLLTVTVASGWTIADMEARYVAGTVADVEADFATIHLFESELP